MRQAVLNLEESMIRQVANAGMGRADVLRFWFGESDEVTPASSAMPQSPRCSRAKPFMPTIWGCLNCGRPLPAMPRGCVALALRP